MFPVDRNCYSFPSYILALTLFQCHLCLLSHNLFPYSSFPTFWAVLQPQLLVALISYFCIMLYLCNYPILTVPYTSPILCPHTITCQGENSLVGGEEKKKKKCCVLHVCAPFLPLLTVAWIDSRGGVLEEGLDPCSHDALTIFCCIPQCILNAWQAIHLQRGPEASLLFLEVSALSGYFPVGWTMTWGGKPVGHGF